MSLARETPSAHEVSASGLERAFADRPALRAGFLAARRHAARHLGGAGLAAWTDWTSRLYHVNAGPKVLAAVWSFERRAVPGAGAETLAAAVNAAVEICRQAGSTDAVAAIVSAETRLRVGGDGIEAAAYLHVLAGLARRAPDGVAVVARAATRLLDALGTEGLAAWIEDGLNLYPKDRRRRAAYFRLEDPVARRRLSVHEGGARFSLHEVRLKLLARALFDLDLDVRTLEIDPARSAPTRSRLAGSLLLMPETSRGLEPGRREAFFEASVLHALAHRRFTAERFAVGRLKPMQIALTAIVEDARVERLAARAYPGLGRLWAAFHTIASSRAQTVASLFARLSRGLADPAFEDDDGWVRKGRAMFEAAFALEPTRQAISREIGNVLGHDLGQLRIPFDGKSYIVEPGYRDDGLGLFDWTDIDPENSKALEMQIEGARMREEERDAADGENPPPEEAERARISAAPPDERGPVLALYSEWDHRLNADHADHVTVRDYPAVFTGAGGGWLAERIAENQALAARIGAMVRRARLDRPSRLRRQIEGDDIDIEAAQDALLAHRLGKMPDPRIHSVKRRRGRDVALCVLLDASASTGDPIGPLGETVLGTAALAGALLCRALDDLGDPLAILAFASDGREDVRLTTIKEFGEPGETGLQRLAGLRAGYSTRLGAAVRHASAGLGRRSNHRRVLIVITDGEPSDIDVEDETYLREDAKRAVAAARAAGLDVFCVALGPRADAASSAVFGRRNTLYVERIADLPQRLADLYFRLTVS